MTATSLAHSSIEDLLAVAEQHRLAGDYRTGSGVAREAAARAEVAGDGASHAAALHSLANQLYRLGALEEAVAACQDAVAVREKLSDLKGICEVLTVQALPLTDLGLYEEALDGLERGRQIAHRLADRGLLYWVHNRTAVVHGSMGNRELSTAYLMQALTLADGMNAEARFCILNNVGDNAVYEVARLRSAGRTEEAGQLLTAALGHVREALALAREAANPYRESISLDNHGMLLGLTGDLEQAEQLIDQAHAIAARHGYATLEMSTLLRKARIRLLSDDLPTAITGLHTALSRAQDLGDKPMTMEIHQELSTAYETAGDPGSALAHYRTFHQLEREARNEVAAVRARMAVHGFELDNARRDAADARTEAERQRVRTVELEADRLSWRRQATEDALTGLPNRRYTDERLPQLVAEGPVCVALADIDHFKIVNDTYGHLVGDEVLRLVAGVLRDHVRDADLVARFGGEEFLIALGGVGVEDARARCEALRAKIAAYPWSQVRPGLAVTVSLGLAVVEGAGVGAALNTADEHLYEAKRAGRNRVVAA